MKPIHDPAKIAARKERKLNPAARKAPKKTPAPPLEAAEPSTLTNASTANLIMQPEPSQPQPKPKQKQIGKTKLDLKHRAQRIVKDILAGQTETQAIINAGYSPAYAVTGKHQILSNPVIQKSFCTILEAAGVTDQKLADKIRSLIDAKEIKYFSNKGEVTDSREVEALPIQMQAVEFAAKLKGHVIDRSQSLNVTVACTPVDLTRWSNRVDNSVDNKKIIDIE